MEYTFTEKDYCALTDSIFAQMAYPNYFSGSVQIVGSDEAEITLTLTIVLYRRRPHPYIPDDEGDTITGVGVVWYDVVVTRDGEVVEEDFDMEQLKDFIING